MSTIARIRAACWGLGVLVVLVALTSCSAANGNAESDRVASIVASAISSPGQGTADGYTRAALATGAGRDSRLVVVEAEELSAVQSVDPVARLVFRIHLKGNGSWLGPNAATTACYEASFSVYGVTGSPRRVRCRPGATPIVPATLTPQPRVVLPQGFEGTLIELLAGLPEAPSAGDVTASVTGGLPTFGVDPNTGLQDQAPPVDAAVKGADVGVSLWAPDSGSCLLGARLAGQVTVWQPTRPSLHAGDLPPCDAQSALQLYGATQPR